MKPTATRHWLATAVVISLFLVASLGSALLTAGVAIVSFVALSILYWKDLRRGAFPWFAATLAIGAVVAAMIALAIR